MFNNSDWEVIYQHLRKAKSRWVICVGGSGEGVGDSAVWGDVLNGIGAGDPDLR